MLTRRIVLDTNVCLDLFVFHDRRCAPLMAALEGGAAQAVTSADCRNEWLRVLDYPNLPLDEEQRERARAAFDAYVSCLAPQRKMAALPLCRDPDDQKFLELARDAHAQALITKDKALLKLARKTARSGLFAIMRPEGWAT